MTTQAPAERVHLELRGSGVVLRTVSPEDREAVWEAEVASLEELRPWFWWCHPEHTRERSAGWVASRDDAWRKGQEYSLLVRATDSERVLGCVFLNAIDKISLRGSLGYWIRPDAGRKGVATEASALIVKWAFEALGLERIEIVAAVANERSQRLAERLGARREGVARKRLRVGGVSTDAMIYALLKDDRPEPPAAAKRPGAASDAPAGPARSPVGESESGAATERSAATSESAGAWASAGAAVSRAMRARRSRMARLSGVGEESPGGAEPGGSTPRVRAVMLAPPTQRGAPTNLLATSRSAMVRRPGRAARFRAGARGVPVRRGRGSWAHGARVSTTSSAPGAR